MITLKVHTNAAAQRFVRSMTARKEGRGCHMVVGDFDFRAKICAKTMNEYTELVWEIHSNPDVDKVEVNVFTRHIQERIERSSVSGIFNTSEQGT